MGKRKFLPSPIRLIRGPARYINLREISVSCNVHPDFVDRLVRLGLIDPMTRSADQNEWIFPADAVPLVRKIMRLRDELGINYTGVGVVLELLSRIEALETRIRELESQIG